MISIWFINVSSLGRHLVRCGFRSVAAGASYSVRMTVRDGWRRSAGHSAGLGRRQGGSANVSCSRMAYRSQSNAIEGVLADDLVGRQGTLIHPSTELTGSGNPGCRFLRVWTAYYGSSLIQRSAAELGRPQLADGPISNRKKYFRDADWLHAFSTGFHNVKPSTRTWSCVRVQI